MRTKPKLERNHEIVLCTWAGKHHPLETVGFGFARDYTREGDSSGSLMLRFTIIDPIARTTSVDNRYGTMADHIGDVQLRLHITPGETYDSADLLGMDISYADSAKLEYLAALLRMWNEKAAKLHVGGRESAETCLRRYFKAMGVQRALSYQQTIGDNKLVTMSIDKAIDECVHPAIRHIRNKLRVAA